LAVPVAIPAIVSTPWASVQLPRLPPLSSADALLVRPGDARFTDYQATFTGILRMNSEPPRIFAFSPRLGKPGWRRGRLSSPLTLRTAAEGADLAIFANIWTHSSLRSPLNA
jgi:hypothetical protein